MLAPSHQVRFLRFCYTSPVLHCDCITNSIFQSPFHIETSTIRHLIQSYKVLILLPANISHRSNFDHYKYAHTFPVHCIVTTPPPQREPPRVLLLYLQKRYTQSRMSKPWNNYLIMSRITPGWEKQFTYPARKDPEISSRRHSRNSANYSLHNH